MRQPPAGATVAQPTHGLKFGEAFSGTVRTWSTAAHLTRTIHTMPTYVPTALCPNGLSLDAGLARAAPADGVRCAAREPGAVDGGVRVVGALAHLARHPRRLVRAVPQRRLLLPVRTLALLLLLAQRLLRGRGWGEVEGGGEGEGER